MKILDLSAGKRGIWFDKNFPLTLYVDKRTVVKPDLVADTRANLVVFDPPHANFGENGNMTKDYGHHTGAEIADTIAQTAREAHRVTADDALMAFKWNDHARRLDNVLGLLAPYWLPLFGQKVSYRTARGNATYWVMLLKSNCVPGVRA